MTELNHHDYTVQCIGCSSRSDLAMVAHRHGDSGLVGWIFVCEQCGPKLYEKSTSIPVEREDVP